MKLVYFAWVRERIGVAEERAEPPDEVATIGDLAAWLRARGEGYALAFADPGVVRAAIDKVHARPDSPIASAREIAFFPPMTGG